MCVYVRDALPRHLDVPRPRALPFSSAAHAACFVCDPPSLPWACGIASLCVIVWDSRVTVWAGQHLLTPSMRLELSSSSPKVW